MLASTNTCRGCKLPISLNRLLRQISMFQSLPYVIDNPHHHHLPSSASGDERTNRRCCFLGEIPGFPIAVVGIPREYLPLQSEPARIFGSFGLRFILSARSYCAINQPSRRGAISTLMQRAVLAYLPGGKSSTMMVTVSIYPSVVADRCCISPLS